MTGRVFCDTSVLVRYFAEDDIPRAVAAAELIDSEQELVISTAVLVELIHALRTRHGLTNPAIGQMLVRFLSRSNVDLVDADKAATIAALLWARNSSARRIPDAVLAAAAARARVDFIATFDERFASVSVPVRML
ncbi:MAG TPA: PIN domain-containing protein [Candidatus Limnocylindrales bacterium]|nr:PIN domain-containing protein [Candidatus Limnocylindrales bacterium]